MIQIEILGKPIPLQRPRAFKRGSFISMYDSQSKEKKQAQWQVRALYKEEPLKCPLIIDIEFGLPIPKHTSKIRTRLMSQGDILPNVKPDIDNLEKFSLDILNGILFEDDSQVIELRARKKYSTQPSTLIRVIPIEERNIKKTKTEISHEGDSRDD